MERSAHHERFTRTFAFALTAVASFGFVFVVRHAVSDVRHLGRGPYADMITGAAGIYYYFWLNRRVSAAWPHGVPTRYLYPVTQAGLSTLVVPGAALVGRIAFTILPPFDEFLGVVIGTAAAVYAWRLVAPEENAPLPVVQQERRRGTDFFIAARAVVRAAALTPDAKNPSIRIGGVELPGYVGTGHRAIWGAVGSGKTLETIDTIRSILPSMTPGSGRRMLIIDAKAELVSVVHDLGPSCPVYNVNPFDERGTAWDVARDVDNPAKAREFAAALFLKENATDREDAFFVDGAKRTTSGPIEVFIERAPGSWTLRDLVNVTTDKRLLKKVLSSNPRTKAVAKQWLETPRTLANVLQNVDNAMDRLRPVAALWEAPGAKARKLSLRRWAEDPDESSILIFSGVPKYRRNFQAISRVMMSIVTDSLLSVPKTPDRARCYFICDELIEAGNLPNLDKLLTLGRSKGVRAFIGMQSIEGMHRAYGEKAGNQIVSMCTNQSFLRLSCPFTADFASRLIGKVEYLETNVSGGTSQSQRGEASTSSNWQRSLVAREAVLPSELMGLPAYEDGTVPGIHVVPKLNGVFASAVRHPLPEPSDYADFVEDDNPDAQRLMPWTRADAVRLGLVEDAAAISSGDDTTASADVPLRTIKRIKMSRGPKPGGK